MKPQFKGWYFKHQNQTQTLAVIPGFCKDHAFIQIITDQKSYMYNFPSLQIRNGSIHIGDCIFSRKGISLSLPDISGTIVYGPLQGLSSDIMGPFRFFPMECRHRIISMRHTTAGTIAADRQPYCFDGGTGYIEGDSGTSFPLSYLWLQSNDFPVPCSIMLSIADIPFGGTRFTGCICALQYRGKEYRLATYTGVHILVATSHTIILSQRNLVLKIELQPSKSGFSLRSPKFGKMVNTIRENSRTKMHLQLWDHHRMVINETSMRTSFEFIPPITSVP